MDISIFQGYYLLALYILAGMIIYLVMKSDLTSISDKPRWLRITIRLVFIAVWPLVILIMVSGLVFAVARHVWFSLTE